MILTAAVAVAMTFASCKSNESAYKKAYEKAKAQEGTTYTTQETTTYTPEVTPLEETRVTETRVVDNSDNAVVRQESLALIDGAGLKAYSVVVGSFSVKANAEGLQRTLKASGYPAQLAYNSNRNMYRVIATTYDSKSDAVYSRDQLRGKYPDAWLLSAQ